MHESFFFPYTIRLYGFLSDISLNEWDLNPVKFQIKLQNFLDCLSPFFQMENTCNEFMNTDRSERRAAAVAL